MKHLKLAIRNLFRRPGIAVLLGTIFFVLTIAFSFCTLMLNTFEIVSARNEDPYSDYYRLVIDKTTLGDEYGYSDIASMEAGSWIGKKKLLEYFEDIEDYSGILVQTSDSMIKLKCVMPDVSTGSVQHKAFKLVGVMRSIDYSMFADGSFALTEGRLLNENDHETENRVCVLSAELAHLNGIGVGDTVTVGLYNQDLYPDKEPLELTVVGLFRDTVWRDKRVSNTSRLSENTVFIPFSVHATTDYAASVFNFQIKVNDERLIPQIEELTNKYRLSFTDNYDCKYVKVSNIYAGRNQGVKILENAVRLIQYLLLSVFSMLVFVYLYSILNRRRREMGIYVALGSPRWGVALSSVIETGIPALIGAVLGADTANAFLKKPAITLVEKVLGRRSVEALSNTTSDFLTAIEKEAQVLDSALSSDIVLRSALTGAGTVLAVFAVSAVILTVAILMGSSMSLLGRGDG